MLGWRRLSEAGNFSGASVHLVCKLEAAQIYKRLTADVIWCAHILDTAAQLSSLPEISTLSPKNTWLRVCRLAHRRLEIENGYST